MTVNRTTLLDLPLPVTGTEAGVWGDITNNGLTQYLDIAIAGRNALTSSDFSAGALTISLTEGDSSATNIAAGSAQYATLYVSSLAQNSTITAPSSNRAYRVVNADATYTLTVKAAGQTGVVFPVNTSGTVVFNGTDYVLLGSYVIASAGTASLPSITFTGDTNTGIFSPAADTIAFTEGGVESMRITSAGEVLVGGTTAMPEIFSGLGSAGLQIQKNVGGSLAFFRDDTTVSGGNNFGVIGFFGNDTTSNTPTLLAYVQGVASSTHAAGDNPTDLVFGTTPDGSATVAEVVRFTQAGNVGIGTSSPSSPLNVVSASSSLAIAINGRSSDNLGAMYFYANNGSTQYSTVTASATEFRLSSVPAAAVQTFYTNGSERMRIASTGGVSIGTTTDPGAGALLVAKGIAQRVSSTTSITSPLAWNSDDFDLYEATAQAGSFTISADAGTPTDARKIIFRFTSDATPGRVVTFTGGASKGFKPIGTNLSVSGSNFTYTLTASKTTYFGAIYDTSVARWEIVALSQET